MKKGRNKNKLTVLNADQIAGMQQTMRQQNQLIWALIKAAGGSITVDKYLLEAATAPECKLRQGETLDKKSIVFGAE